MTNILIRIIALVINCIYLAVLYLIKEQKQRDTLPLFFVVASGLLSIIEVFDGNYEMGAIGLEYIIYLLLIVIGMFVHLIRKKPTPFREKQLLYINAPFVIVFIVEALFVSNLLHIVVISGLFAFIPSILLLKYFGIILNFGV